MREISEIINFHDNFMKERDVMPTTKSTRTARCAEHGDLCLSVVGGWGAVTCEECLSLSVCLCLLG